jgi:hypothetical protein
MFSNDLWNLVYCHKDKNPKKSNRLPVERDIVQLETGKINISSVFYFQKDFLSSHLKNIVEEQRRIPTSCSYKWHSGSFYFLIGQASLLQ